MSEFHRLQEICGSLGLGPCSGKGINANVLRARIEAYEREKKEAGEEKEEGEMDGEEIQIEDGKWKNRLRYTLDTMYRETLDIFQEIRIDVKKRNLISTNEGSYRIRIYGEHEKDENNITTVGDFILVSAEEIKQENRLFIDFFFVEDFNMYLEERKGFDAALTNVIRFSNNMEWLEERLEKRINRLLSDTKLRIHYIETAIEDFRENKVVLKDPKDEMNIHSGNEGIAALISFVIVI